MGSFPLAAVHHYWRVSPLTPSMRASDQCCSVAISVADPCDGYFSPLRAQAVGGESGTMAGLVRFRGASPAGRRQRRRERLVPVVAIVVAFPVAVAGGLRIANSHTPRAGASGKGPPGPELAPAGATFTAVVRPTADGNDVEGRLAGTAMVTTNADDELCLSVSVMDMKSPGMGHLHYRAREAVLAALSLDAVPVASNTACTKVDDAVALELVLRPEQFVVEVHVEHRPIPVARGELLECPLRCSA